MKALPPHAALLLTAVIVLSPLSARGDSFLEGFRDGTSILPNSEVRAAWVVRFALASRDDIDRAIDYATRARFQLLFVQVRGRGDAFYRSRLEPAGAELLQPTDTFDPLAYFLERAHAQGIAVHAWVNVFYVWSDGSGLPPPDHIVRQHPEWLMSDSEGTRMDERSVEYWKGRGLEGYYVSPGNPEVRAHITDVIGDIVDRYPVDGVHLDYVRYPGPNFDFGPVERTNFALRYGIDPLAVKKDPERYRRMLGDGCFERIDSLLVDWRVSRVDSLVTSVRRRIGDLPLSAAVIPDFTRARRDKGQDWLGWVMRGDVDFVVPMAYVYEPADLLRHMRVVKRAIGSDKFLVGLPVFDGRSRYLGYSVSLLRQEGILGYSLFSYNVLEEEQFSLQFLERVFLQTDQ